MPTLNIDYGCKKPVIENTPLFITAGVSELLESDENFAKEVCKCLGRHLTGDWGDTCEEDVELNNQAVVSGHRIISSYNINPKIWIITDAADDDGHRAATTILYPDEY